MKSHRKYVEKKVFLLLDYYALFVKYIVGYRTPKFCINENSAPRKNPFNKPLFVI